MRVLILSQHFWPESFRINALVEALERQGAEATVLTGQPNYPDGLIYSGYSASRVIRERYAENVEVVRVPLIPRARGTAARLVANYLSYVASASTLAPWLLRGKRFDALFVYGTSPIMQAIPGIVLKYVKGAPLVTWVQDLWPESLESTGYVKHPALLSLVDVVVRWIYRSSDLILGQSHAFVSAITAKAGGTPVEFLPNPGDAQPSSATSAHKVLTLPTGFSVVFTGNLGTVQALETVIEAAALLRDERDVRFVLVGSGSRAAWLADVVTQRQLDNVLLYGRVDVSAVPAILAQASALLVSLSRGRTLSQTIPSKVQSYLAAGRPILASLDGEGADLVVAAGAGLASPAEDARALADNVMHLKRLSEAERERMGASARSFYDRNFQPDVLATQLLDRLRVLITPTPRSA